MTPIITTAINFHFISRTLVLFESIISKCPDAILHCLCLDEYTFNKFKEIKYKNLIPHHKNEFFNDDKEALLIEKTSFNPLHSKKQNELNILWSLGAPFTHYIFNSYQYDNISFIDSDTCFYGDIVYIFKKMDKYGADSCIFENLNSFKHRDEGYYGVQVLSFKNTKKGKNILKWWRDSVIRMEPKELAVFGDQKFLEGFFDVEGRESVYVGSKDFAHGDPAYYRFYNWEDYFVDGTLRWGYEKKPLMWIHFTHRHAKMLKETITDYKPSRILEERVKIHKDLYQRKADLLLEDILIKAIPELGVLYTEYYNNIDRIADKFNIPKQSYSEIYYQIKE
jgi:hypothetical protein